MTKKGRAHHVSRQERQRNSGNPTMAMISGIGLGAGIMYALDPDRGRRRRAMAQQKLFRLFRQAADAVDKGIRDLEHRGEGLLAEAFSVFHSESVSDHVLAQRVRAKLGRVACHPGSIEVRAQAGNIVLSGPVLRGEREEIVHAVRRVRGVRAIDVQLQEHDSSENIPGLQGRNIRPGDRPELLQENWSPGTRLVMGALGVSLLARSVRRPGVMNTVAGIAGIALITRAARRSRVLGTLLDALKPMPGPRAGHLAGSAGRIEAGVRTAGLGRRDEVGRSGVYPVTGPLPLGPAEVRPAASFGQGERGAAGYEDHGTSGLTYTGGQVLGALSPEASNVIDLDELLRAREIPREQWRSFFDQLSKALIGHNVTVQVREGDKAHTEQRNLPLQGIAADTKDREHIVNLTVGHNGSDEVTHLINARRATLRDSGQNKLLEIEAQDGPVTVVRFRAADVKKIIAA